MRSTPAAYRAYRAHEEEAANGHLLGRWYFRPVNDASPYPASAPYDTAREAQLAAMARRSRALMGVPVHLGLRGVSD